ncbi:MAG TPA: hypothetical protein VKR57_08835 [Terriglobales bacterium]|nr:hypothetical protein [Terriglobales bacterium]
MKSRKLNPFWLGPALLVATPTWCQQPSASPDPTTVPATKPAANAGSTSDSSPMYAGDHMLTPPPVSGQSFPAVSVSQERSNYLRAGVSFTSAYSDNAVPVNGHPESDVSNSVAPTLAIDETTSRTHLVTTYAPGFTFYQRLSSLNEADQNASIDFTYRLSPHVTFAAHDGFQKSSNVFNQADLASASAVSGGTQGGNFSIIAPIADHLSNAGNLGITYQFALNEMIGASGTFTNLHYPNQAEVPGLFDSESQGGAAFYSLRVSKVNYLGAAYQYQRLLSFPAPGANLTQTHALLLFYTLYPTTRFSVSFFGGPQYADSGPQFSITASTPSPASRSWNPAAGASLSWQGRLSNLAVSYLHMISGGGGLIGAVRQDNATASISQELSKTLSAAVIGGYAQNDILATPLTSTNGHTLSGTVSVRQQFGQHFGAQLGYTRLHQDYSGVAVLATAPNTNREFVSVSYQFARSLGR